MVIIHHKMRPNMAIINNKMKFIHNNTPYVHPNQHFCCV